MNNLEKKEIFRIINSKEYIEPKQGKAYVTANEIAYERIIKTLPNYIAEKYSVTYNEKTDEIIIKRKADNADNNTSKIKKLYKKI